jgi:hypothetical protein
MAITACPSCSKPISDKAKSCSHCGFNIGSATAEDIERKAKLAHYLAMQKLQNQSMLAILLFVAGCGFVYWGGSEPGEIQYNFSIGTAIVGFVWYAVNRVRLVLAKRK